MRAVNRFVKGIAFAGIHLLLIVYSYALGLAFSSPFMCAVCAVINMVLKSLPALVAVNFWKVWFIVAVPFGLILLIMIEFDVMDLHTGYKARRRAVKNGRK